MTAENAGDREAPLAGKGRKGFANSTLGRSTMRIPSRTIVLSGVALSLAIGLYAVRDGALPHADAQTKKKKTAAAPQSGDRDADRAAIEKSSRDFSEAFAKGDAKAIAAMWTENGEYHDDEGVSLKGRAAIEKEFAEHFQEKRAGKVHMNIESIRFPARDLAIEDGIVRQEGPGKELPQSTRYSVLHVREGGQWKIAVSKEWGAGQDRLEDLGWLVGAWTTTIKDQEVSLTFQRDPAKACITGQFTKKDKGKTVGTGTMRIALDPQSGQLRSWHFDDDGGHGQARWIRDGNRWALDAVGVTADGVETAGINLLARVSADQITWRSVERLMGGQRLPDTLPIKLTRVKSSK